VSFESGMEEEVMDGVMVVTDELELVW